MIPEKNNFWLLHTETPVQVQFIVGGLMSIVLTNKIFEIDTAQWAAGKKISGFLWGAELEMPTMLQCCAEHSQSSPWLVLSHLNWSTESTP